MLGTLVLAVAGVFAFGVPVGATPTVIDAKCDVHSPGTDLGIQPQQITFEAVAPNSVDLGDEFTITIPFRPGTLDDGGAFGIGSYTDSLTTYRVVGGTIVPGSLTSGDFINNGNVLPTVTTIQGNELDIAWAGPAFPGTLDAPETTIRVTPDAAGGAVTLRALHSLIKPRLLQGVTLRVDCTLDTDLVATHVGLDALDDSVSTRHDVPATFDVLANDVPSPTIAVDPQSLGIVSNPAHGTASVTADHKILYSPAKFYAGPDSFTYRVCAPATVQCDTATVQVTVIAALINVADVRIPEGNHGWTRMKFTITLDERLRFPVTVQYTTVDVNTTPGVDYRPIIHPRTARIRRGQLTTSVYVSIHGDTTPEALEGFLLTFSNPVGADLGVPEAFGVILNDD